jgi:cell division protein FtsA
VEKNYIAAIDLGSRNVVVAVGTRAADGRVKIEEIAVRESAGVEGGEVKNVETASAAVRAAVDEIEKKLGVRITEACTGISGDHIQCAKHPYHVYVAGKDGEITASDVRQLNENMRNIQAPDGYRLMHIVPQHYSVDEQEEVMDPVGRFGKTLGSTFNLVIGKSTIISRLEKALQKAGVSQAKLFINPLAVAEAVTFPDEKAMGVAVVDIGAGTTDVSIYQGGIMRDMSVIPMGADSINRDIQSYGIMERYVEDLKTMYGCAVAEMVDPEKRVKVPGRTPSDYKEISFRDLAAIIEARMTDIIDFVVEEIEASGYSGRLGAGIVLTGGGARLQEIKALLERRTGMEVRVAAPEIVVTAESREKAGDPAVAAAVGILWQGMGSGVETRVESVASAEVHDAQTVYDRLVQGQRVDDEDRDAYDDGRRDRKKKKRRDEQAGAKADEPKTEGGKRGGWFSGLGRKLNRIVDFDDVLDDDTAI